jgi:redox-sensitive bicupin YhaK (pirin superfamily)
MTWTLSAPQGPTTPDPVATVLIPRARDLGDFAVRRALPAADARSIGPFVFFDQMGPVTFGPGKGMDVRPHPHIGLSTITWLFQGEIQHKDSLGYDVTIRPGEVNWMTAGSGIVHSERSPAWARSGGAMLSGIQTWVALPKEQEECVPSFQHYPGDVIPRMDEKGLSIALIAGAAFGQRSPVVTASETLYAELKLKQGVKFFVPLLAEEQALYVADGSVTLAGTTYDAGTMLVLKRDTGALVTASTDAVCMLLGGTALDAPRHLYWNFVSSSLDRLEQAKDDWRNLRFALVEGDPEFIPLPG